MSASIVTIEDGRVYLSLVDTSVVGPPAYDDTWMAPGGKDLTTVAESDYGAEVTTWSCQVTSGMLSASANQNDVTTPATFCQPSIVTPQPGQTSYTLDLEWLQDVKTDTGLSRFLFEHDTEELYFFLGLDGENPPKAIGRVRAIAGSFGGPARENLTSTVSLPCSRKPEIEFGTEGDSTIVTGTEVLGATVAGSEPTIEPMSESESELASV